MLFKDFLTEWLENKRNSVRRQTFTNYVTICNSHIIPELGTLSIQQLNPFTLQKFVNSLCEKGFATSYIKKVIDVLNGSLEKAKKLDMIARNPMELVEKPRISKQEMKVWDVNEVEKFLATAQEERLYVAFLLAITTGMRQGEILGLRWKDLDFENCSLSISQTLSHDGKELQTEAKTKSSIRAIHLPTETLLALRKHRSLIIQEKLQAGDKYVDHDLVVCTSVGTPVIPRNLTRTWKRLIEQAGVAPIRFHDLRHTHATLLLKQGIHIKVVADRLGHTDTRMTLDTYSHIQPSMQVEAANAISQALFKKQA
ncbi:tyrosine-type recombinase/integrase [Brevibacillus ruminantium]|uniref:Tyrosine-type recombinase/integrase n=1 Tax=Brevibacillus ruminantium TaxID=2950604 RepID=A0ABY4WKY9_9BACL|nr:site-specific integrase [Brevibacillus ruminantium]USG67334.1 tyrosine-type recombinase/integrase [Brevibacillus ruminantium]